MHMLKRLELDILVIVLLTTLSQFANIFVLR